MYALIFPLQFLSQASVPHPSHHLTIPTVCRIAAITIIVSNSTIQWDYPFCKTTSSSFLISAEALLPSCQLPRLQTSAASSTGFPPFSQIACFRWTAISQTATPQSLQIPPLLIWVSTVSWNSFQITLHLPASRSPWQSSTLHPCQTSGTSSAGTTSSALWKPHRASHKAFPESVPKYGCVTMNPDYCAATKTQWYLVCTTPMIPLGLLLGDGATTSWRSEILRGSKEIFPKVKMTWLPHNWTTQGSLHHSQCSPRGHNYFTKAFFPSTDHFRLSLPREKNRVTVRHSRFSYANGH